MIKESKIQWCTYTWNPFHGCKKVSDGCKYCLDGETLILLENFQNKKISDINIGDKLFSIEEYPSGKTRKFITSEVENIGMVEKESYEIITDDGTIIASEDHPFFSNSHKWIEVKKMQINRTKLSYIGRHNNFDSKLYQAGYICGITDGDGTFRYEKNWGSVWKKESPQCYWRLALSDKEPLLYVKEIIKNNFGEKIEIKPFAKRNEIHQEIFKIETRSQLLLRNLLPYFEFNITPDYLAGYLGGMFDAEGNMSFYTTEGRIRLNALRIAQSKNDDKIKRIKTALDCFGFEYSYNGTSFCLNGGTLEKIRFFQIANPTIKRKMNFDGINYKSQSSLIKSIIPLGKRKLYDIQTSSHTFIANGFITHNCYMYRDKERYGQEFGT